MAANLTKQVCLMLYPRERPWRHRHGNAQSPGVFAGQFGGQSISM